MGTMTTGILMPTKFPFINVGSPATLFTMITPTAPAACALSALSWKLDAPRCITRTLPATCAAVFCSAGDPVYGTARTMSPPAGAAAGSKTEKTANWPAANFAQTDVALNETVASSHAADPSEQTLHAPLRLSLRV